MGVDPLSPVAPVRLNVLLLPVGKIRRSRFLAFVARIQAENVIRLGDVSPDARPNRNMFTPLAFPTGMILYDLSISVPPTSHLELFPFELFREPLIVIAIADGAELQGDTTNFESRDRSSVKNGSESNQVPNPAGLSDLVRELALVKEHNPRALVCQLLVFEYDGVEKLMSEPEEVMWVPSPRASKATTMKTVLCDITSMLLGELDEFAKLMQSIPAIDSPRASSWGPRRGPELRPRPVDKLIHRMTMPAQLPPGPNGDSESAVSSGRSSPAAGGHDSPTTFDEITRSISVASRSNSTGKPPSSKETSRDRMSVQGLSAADRTKNRIRGRLGVVIGNLYLQSGRWPDALKELVEAASMSRASSDYIWHGKALESILLCLLMFGWAGMDFQIPQICYPVTEKSSSKSSHANPVNNTADVAGQSTPGNRVVSLQNLANLIPDLCNNILNLYNRAAVITDEPLPPLVFSETVIRLSRLLSTIRLRDGSLDNDALSHIVMNEPLAPSQQPERPRGAPLLKKNEIANVLFRALPLALGAEMPATDAVPILVGIASVLSTVDLPRKKAFVLKELLSIMVPRLVEARKIGAAEIGIHPAAGLASLSNTAFEINALDVGPGNMEESTRALLSMIGETYGVQPSVYQEHKENRPSSANGNFEHDSDYDSIAAIVERAFRHTALNAYGDLLLKIDILKASINLCEALPDFEGVLQYTVELLQTIRGDLMLPETSRIPPLLPPDEQIRLFNNIKRTVSAARKLGAHSLHAEYWDDFLVRGVELLDFPEFKRPFRRTKKDLNIATAPTNKPKIDPFLYSPFSKINSKATELLLIAKEYATFKVTLQNPYEFDLEIENIRLHSEGCSVDAEVFDIWIPPFTLQDILVPGVAITDGVLNITGCIIKVRHCRSRNFPIFTKPWKPVSETKVKRLGLAAKEPPVERPLSWSSKTSRDGKVVSKMGPETSTCSVKVINQQPAVMVHSTSLSQSAMMILEGETKSFEITLHNTSSCPVDFILFTFQDSTTRQLQTALNNKDLLPAEIYELDLQLSTRPPLRWLRHGTSPHDLRIEAGQKATFVIEVFGKPGLQDALVQIDYCHLGTSHDEIPETFYTRQLSVPITVTVNASVEVARCDMVPLSGDFAWLNQTHGSHLAEPEDISASSSGYESGTGQFGSVLSRLGLRSFGADHCLAVLDLRNAWPNSLSVGFQVTEQPLGISDGLQADVDSPSTVTGKLQPGQLSRFVLVLPRIFLDNPYKAIPVLNTGFRRQFVVSANKLTFEAEGASREAFWFREELLKRISGWWKEESTSREGRIDLRSIRLNPRMVDAIRLEEVEVMFSLSSLDDKANEVTQTRRLKFVARTNDFLTLIVKIHNRSSRPIHPLLRLQPSLCNQPSTVALDLSKRLAWTGMLQRVLPVIHGRTTAEATLGLTVLCRGEYEIGASVEEVRIIKPSLGKEDAQSGDIAGNNDDADIADTFGADITRTRKIWHAGEHCMISTRD